MPKSPVTDEPPVACKNCGAAMTRLFVELLGGKKIYKCPACGAVEIYDVEKPK